jgi:CHAD domain-containing protein
MTDAHVSDHAVLARNLDELRTNLHRLDPHVRDDLPDAVHQMRVTCRRLRAMLTTFRTSLDRDATDPVGDDLRWLGGVLGGARDLEVLRDRLDRLLLAQPSHLVRDHPGPWIDERLAAARRKARSEVLDAMASDRYAALLAALDAWHEAPPWAGRPDRPARKRLARSFSRAWTRLERAGAAAAVADAADRPARLHDVRKAAKRCRYAGEMLAPVLGAGFGRQAAQAERIQDLLGEHHDCVVGAERVRELADLAHGQGRDTFTLGVLGVRLEAEAVEHERAFAELWDELGHHGDLDD